MKKGLILLVAIAIIGVFTSCEGANPKEAAQALCECYDDYLAAQIAVGEASNTTETMEASKNLEQVAEKANECHDKWDTEYNGKTQNEAFKAELKEMNEDIYLLMEDKGMF